jgi:hypothetical protein
MKGYYAYIIGDDGHIVNRVDVLCDDDDEAKRCAQQLVDGHAVELWQEARMIASFEPEKQRPP